MPAAETPLILPVFSRSDSPACKFIRRFDGGEWSHCGLMVGSRVVEAVARVNAVRNRQADSFFKDRPLNTSFVVNIPNPQGVLDFVDHTVDDPYDWFAIPSIVLRSQYGTAPRWQRPGRWYCAEWLLTALAKGGAIDPRLADGRRGVQHAFSVIEALAVRQNKALTPDLFRTRQAGR